MLVHFDATLGGNASVSGAPVGQAFFACPPGGADTNVCSSCLPRENSAATETEALLPAVPSGPC